LGKLTPGPEAIPASFLFATSVAAKRPEMRRIFFEGQLAKLKPLQK
jgi:hypothetical protein